MWALHPEHVPEVLTLAGATSNHLLMGVLGVRVLELEGGSCEDSHYFEMLGLDDLKLHKSSK